MGLTKTAGKYQEPFNRSTRLWVGSPVRSGWLRTGDVRGGTGGIPTSTGGVVGTSGE